MAWRQAGPPEEKAAFMFTGDNPVLKNYNGKIGMGFSNGNAKRVSG
jgi:hypothetical protein